MRVNKPWGAGETATLVKHYARLGASGMKKAGYLVDRPLGSITKHANLMGLRYHAAKDDSANEWPMPRMDLLESLDCVRLANWGRPDGSPPMQLCGMVA